MRVGSEVQWAVERRSNFVVHTITPQPGCGNHCRSDRTGVASEHETGFVPFRAGIYRQLLWVWPHERRDQDHSNPKRLVRGKVNAGLSNHYRKSRLPNPDQTNA